MAVRIIVDEFDTMAALYCSTSMTAFGPVVCEKDGALDKAQLFLDYCWDQHGKDPRLLTEKQLMDCWHDFNVNVGRYSRDAL